MDRKWFVLAVTAVASFMTPLDSSITNVAMPSIANAMGVSFNAVSLVPLFYLLSLGVFMIPLGKLADIHGRKHFFLAGLVIFTIASFTSGIAGSITSLIVSRIAQGFGSALLSATSVAILTEAFPPEKRGMAIGVNISAVYTGLTLGPFLGGLITQYLGWRYIFLVNVPIGIISFIGAWMFIEKRIIEQKEKARFSWAGGISLCLFLSSVFLSTNPVGRPWILALLPISLISLVVFLFSEFKGENPVIGLRHLMRNRMFVAANLTALLNYVGLFAVSFMMAFYFVDVRGFSSLNAGLILVATPVTMALLSPLCGWLSDKIGSRFLSSAGMALITLGLVLFSFISIDTPMFLLLVGLFINGLGMGLFSSPNTSAVMGSVEKVHLSIASSVLGTLRFLGQALSITIMTAIFSYFVNPGLMAQLSSGIIPDTAKLEFVQGMSYVLMVFSAITFVGVFTSLLRNPGKRPEGQ